MSMTFNKNLNLLLSLHINCISAKSAPQILPIKGDCNIPNKDLAEELHEPIIRNFNSTNFIVRSPLTSEILSNMCNVILC